MFLKCRNHREAVEIIEVIREKKCANIHLTRLMKVIKKDRGNTNHAIEKIDAIQETAIVKNLRETGEAEVLVPAHQVLLALLHHHLPVVLVQERILKIDPVHHQSNEIVS